MSEQAEALSRQLRATALDELRARVLRAAGNAMVSAAAGKRVDDVTEKKALAILETFVREGADDEDTWRIARAGVVAAIAALGGIFPETLGGLVADTFRALDDGEARGLATPAKARRGQGKPSRYGPPSRLGDLGRWLVMEIGFQAGRKPLSFDASIGLTTGVTRDGEPSPHGPTPLLPLPMKWDTVRRFADETRKREPELWDAAVAQGQAAAHSQPLDPTFASDRLGYLALAKDPDAWRSILTKAGLMRRRRKRRRRL
jgi:hypothetical protein